MNKWIGLLIAIPLLCGIEGVAGSSTNKLDDPMLSTCDGAKARKKFVFTVANYSKVPSGMPVNEVSLYLGRLKSAYDSAISNWVKFLLSVGFQANPDGKTSRLEGIKALEHLGVTTSQA